MRKPILFSTVLFAVAAQAWDVEHDEVVQLTGEYLPAEVRGVFAFDDFSILLRNCHFPDLIEWKIDGKIRGRDLHDLEAWVGARDRGIFEAAGYRQGNWLHGPRGRALMMSLLARAFAEGEHARAAFYISVLSHAVSDESALNHPPILQFAKYTNFRGIDYRLRKVEEGAKNVFGFRSDGHVVQLVRERMAGYRPQLRAGDFSAQVLELTADAVRQAAYAAEKEGVIAFAPQPEAERALADLVAMQVKFLEDVVWTCWKGRSVTAALPAADFDARCEEKMAVITRTLDPAKQAVFAGVFDARRNPIEPRATVAVVCEPYATFSRNALLYVGRMFAGMSARTLRQNGYAVKGVSFWQAERAGLPAPSEAPLLLVFLGNSRRYNGRANGPTEAFAAQVRAYLAAGGRLLAVGGNDPLDMTGLADVLRKRPNAEVPCSAAWADAEAAPLDPMRLVFARDMRRLAAAEYRFVRSPNVNGFCKPVSCEELAPAAGVVPLVTLDTGKVRYLVGGRRGRVTWLPAYLFMPYLYAEQDPHLDFGELVLDPPAEKVLLDAVEQALGR